MSGRNYAYVSLTTECSVCTQEYGNARDREPRVLRCGHTFCTECLERMCSQTAASEGTRSSLACPFCTYVTPVPFQDVTRVPLNYSMLDLLTRGKQSTRVDTETRSLCEYCCERDATLVCFNCSLIGVRFCDECDRQEHERSFKPAQLHRRVPIDQVELVTTCPVHDGYQAVLFSELHDRFACLHCQQQPDWPALSSSFISIAAAASKLRRQAINMNCLCAKELNKVFVASSEVEDALSTLRQSSSLARQEIKQDFATLRRLLADREKELLSILTEEFQTKKERLQQQKQQLVEHTKRLSLCHEEIQSLLQADDISFLKVYRNLTEQTRHFLNSERGHILSPVAPANIPVFFSGDLKSEISNHGIMGGGPEPRNLTCQRLLNSSESTLLQLSWALPDKAPGVTQYEIEYESVTEHLFGSPAHSGEIVRRPQRVVKSGKAQAHTMNDLYPGQRYRFRVRSSSLAGWGVWSDCATSHFADFPLKIPFTGEKVSFRIPEDGSYCITAAGAKAANGRRWKGGQGAVVKATMWLHRHNRVEVVVGGMSECDQVRGHSGGGGGTFVVLCENGEQPSLENLLVAAGGGGGTRGMDDYDCDGSDASLDPCGSDGKGTNFGKGGQNGGPGMDADAPWQEFPSWGYGGAGFLKGSACTCRAKSYLDGSEGGQCGGFGGGGGVGLGGGGGGGYSGGGGGQGGGGGGGTYVIGTAVVVEKKIGNADHGYVIIARDIEGGGNWSHGDHMTTPSPGNLSRRTSSSPTNSPQNSRLHTLNNGLT